MTRLLGVTDILADRIVRTEIERDQAQATIARVAALHRPYSIYTECGHDHDPGEPGVLDVDDVGLVCDEGKMYDICASCCVHNSGSGQDMECMENHFHSKDAAICVTFSALHAGLSV